jgi:Domain of unknown function (DUF4386)
MNNTDDRLGATCAFIGCVLLGLGTSMHPMQADPNNAAAAFAEYAADQNWITGHLLQFVGIALLLGFMLVLSRQLRATSGLRQVATGGAIASLAVAAALQAVDGVALKAMVDSWAAAPAAEKAPAFSAAFAVRQVEIGLASLLSILFGATSALFGLLLHGDGRYPRWIGGAAFAGGAGIAAGGVMIARGGFTALAMNIQLPASLMVLAWVVGVAALHWRRWQTPPAK